MHKQICKVLKKLSHQLQPYQDVVRIIREINLDLKPLKRKHLIIRVLKYLIAYEEHQFGDRVEGLAHRERENGESLDNWNVEIDILFPTYESFILVYENDESLRLVVRDTLEFPCIDKMLNLLRPWSASINLNSSGLSDSLNGDQINRYLQICSTTEWRIALIYPQRN